MTDDELIKLARQRMTEANDAEEDNREEARLDFEALSGNQWPDHTRKSREKDNRPCLTINRLPQFVRQVTGDIRSMNPAISVIPGDREASEEVAEVVEGLVRQIQNASDASSVYEAAAESAAQCSMGYFRVLTKYEEGDSFDQEIKIARIHNPFSVFFDPMSREPTRKDANWCFVTEAMRGQDFEDMYPNAAKVAVEHDGELDGLTNWVFEDQIVVAEYFWKEPDEYEIGALADGRVVRDPPPEAVKKRTVKSHKIMWAKVTGKEVLEGPMEIPGKHIPIVAVVGEELHIGERVVRTSVIRFARDPQQLYNYWRSAQTELVALQPKAPFMVSTKQIAGLESLWAAANTENRPYLPYNPDEKAGAPQRAMPPVSSQGMMQEVSSAAEDLKATTGVYDAALGGRSNETSGVAIRQRQMESDTSTSIYSDNMAKAVAHAGNIIVGMIPKVYDTARVIRILGKDDAEKMVPINGVMTQDGQPVPSVPLTIGKYDVKVSVGPNYATKRQAAAENMIEFARAYPAAMPLIGDLIAKNMDWPGADDMAERLKKALPPGMISPEDLPPEEQQKMMQAQQQAQQQQQAEMQMAQARMQLEMQGEQADIQETQADVLKKQADAQKTQVETARAAAELAMMNGEINAVVSQMVQAELARVLGPMQAQPPR